MIASFLLLASLRLDPPADLYPIAYEVPIANSGQMQIKVATSAAKASVIDEGQYPATSPDHKWIAYAKTTWVPDDGPGTAMKTELCLANVAMHKVRTLAKYQGALTVSMPSFTRDGKKICFELTTQRFGLNDPQSGIYVFDLATSKSSRVYGPQPDGVQYEWPSYTDKDTRILFVEKRDIVWLNLADGKLQRRPMRDLIGPTADAASIAMIRTAPNNSRRFFLTLKPLNNDPINAALDYRAVYTIDGATNKFAAVTKDVSAWGIQWHPSDDGFVYYEQSRGSQDTRFAYCDWTTKEKMTLGR